MANEKPAGLRSFLRTAIWGGQIESMPGWKAAVINPVRLVLVLARDLAHGQITLRAMGLVYTTLLSLVPLLALSFSVLKAFGVYNQTEPILIKFLAPLGDKSREISAWVIKFIENLNIGVLGSIGLILLIYTAVSLMQKIEESFNFIWHVGQLRSFARRFSGYLSVLLIGPVLIFTTMGITSAITDTAAVRQLLAMEPVGGIAYAVGQALPVVFVIAGFTLAYGFVPNTRVRADAALMGGAVAGTVWQLANWAFAEFVAKSTQYAAIYSTFAILILTLIWVYLNWLILLLGASIAFYRQHPEYVVPEMGEPRLSNRMRERVALMAMYLIGRAYYDGGPAWTFAALTQRLGVPMHALRAVLTAMQQAGLVSQTGDDPPAYLPARDMGTITLKELLATVRAAGEDRYLSPDSMPAPPELEAILLGMDQAVGEQVHDRTLRDLVSGSLQGGTGQPPGALSGPESKR
jgi:membrane protein